MAGCQVGRSPSSRPTSSSVAWVIGARGALQFWRPKIVRCLMPPRRVVTAIFTTLRLPICRPCMAVRPSCYATDHIYWVSDLTLWRCYSSYSSSSFSCSCICSCWGVLFKKRFKSDRNEIWQECSSSKCASAGGVLDFRYDVIISKRRSRGRSFQAAQFCVVTVKTKRLPREFVALPFSSVPDL